MTVIGLPYADATRSSIDYTIIVLAVLSILLILPCILLRLAILSKSFSPDRVIPRAVCNQAIFRALALVVFSGYGIARRVDLFLWIYPDILALAPIGSLLLISMQRTRLSNTPKWMIFLGLCLAATAVEVIVFVLCGVAFSSPLIPSTPSIIEIVFGSIACLLLIIPMFYTMLGLCAPQYASFYSHPFPLFPGSKDTFSSMFNMLCAAVMLVMTILDLLDLGTDYITIIYYSLYMVESIAAFVITLFIAQQKVQALLRETNYSNQDHGLTIIRSVTPELTTAPAILCVLQTQDQTKKIPLKPKFVAKPVVVAPPSYHDAVSPFHFEVESFMCG